MYSAVLGHHGTLEHPRNGIFPLAPFHNVLHNHMKAAIWLLICNALCNAFHNASFSHRYTLFYRMFHNAAFSHIRNVLCNALHNDLCKKFHNVPYSTVRMSCNNMFDIFLSIYFL